MLEIPLCEVLSIVKFTDTEGRRGGARGWGRKGWGASVIGYVFAVWQDENVLERDGVQQCQCTYSRLYA